MKILYHHRTASRDGQAVHIDEMIQALRDQGHQVMVVAPGSGNAQMDSAPAERHMGQRVGWVHWLRQRLPKAIYELLEFGYSLLAYSRLRRAALAFKPDVLYERYNLFMVAGALLAWRRRIPYLVEVNAPLADEREQFGGLSLHRLARWTERMVWTRADRVFVVTAVLGRIVAQAGAQASRITVTPNGINPEHFAQAPEPQQAKEALGWSGSLILGFTGFVRDWHGVDRVIRWLASPQAPAHARLLVVGDGPAREQLETLAGQLNLQHRVRFTGLVHRHEVPALVAAFDIALQPAVVPYASPLKLFEYLALGKAVVAPRLPNIQEVLDHGQNAWLFDPADSAALESSLTTLAADAALRERLAQAARQTITRRRLTWSHNAGVAVDAAHQLIHGAPHDRARTPTEGEAA